MYKLKALSYNYDALQILKMFHVKHYYHFLKHSLHMKYLLLVLLTYNIILRIIRNVSRETF